MTQGALFSAYFLDEGIAETRGWSTTGAADLAPTRTHIADLLQDFASRGSPTEADTETGLVEKLLAVLGWGELFFKQATPDSKGRNDVPDYLLCGNRKAFDTAKALESGYRRFPHGVALLEAKAWDVPLDKSEPGHSGAPSTQILRYLGNAEGPSNGAARFGILTNGRIWRLYDNKAQPRLEGFVEIDLMEAAGLVVPAEKPRDDHADHMLRLFLWLFAREAFVPDAGGATRLTDAIAESRSFEARVTEALAHTVFETVYPDLVRHLAENDALRPADIGPAYLADLREAALTWLYRLLFVLYAEDRSLLPTRRRRDGLKAMREDVARATDAKEGMAASRSNWDGDLRALWGQIDTGDEGIGLPPYNGGLFRKGRSALLDRSLLPDRDFAPLLDALSREVVDDRRRFINYRGLTVQHLGSVYERLLEHDPRMEDGHIVIRPQTFARKTSGSYYTPEDLVMLVIRRTVGPLLDEKRQVFADAVAEEARTHQAKEAPEYPLARIARYDPAQAFLELRICDPAMGSGHFLVSLVDYLADQVMLATGDAAALVDFGNYRSPLLTRLETIRTRIREQADEHGWTVEDSHLVDRQLVRRIILKRVIHGVDKNPMAVELAKLSLWLHTFTVGAPLSFLDHHLRCGDSLFGEWVHSGMNALERGGLYVSDDLKDAQQAITEMAVVEDLTDADIVEVRQSASAFGEMEEKTAALARKLALLQGYRWIGESTESALKKAKALEKESVRTTDPKLSFELTRQAWELKRKGTALDVLLGGQLGELNTVLDYFYGRVSTLPEATKPDDPALEPLAAATDVARTSGFLAWELAFPNVWTNWRSAAPGGGFDAVIGNPPWDRLKMQEVEWFEARKREIAYATRASDRKAMVARLKTDGDPLAAEYDRASRFAAMASRMANLSPEKGGEFPLLGHGDVNLYSLFVERAQRLVRPDGLVGLLTPSGIAGDLGASRFFKSISTSGRLACLLDFENRGAPTSKLYFADVDSRFKFCALVFGGKDRTFPAARCGFFLGSTSEARIASDTFPLTPADFAAVNPNSGTAPVFRTPRDADLTTRIYAEQPVLVRHAPNKATRDIKAWPVKYNRMFDMTNDSHLFRTRAELEAEGWYDKAGVYGLSKGEARAVPLYVGRMFNQFDHRAANVTVNEENLHNAANSDHTTAIEKADPSFQPEPQYWVDWSDVEPQRDWSLAFRDIARPTDVRTMIASIVPGAAYGNKAPVLLGLDSSEASLLCANLNSLVLDFVARSKLQGTNANWYIVEQLPVIPPAAYDRSFGPETARDIVRREVLHLTYTAHDMAAFARDMGYFESPLPFRGGEGGGDFPRTRPSKSGLADNPHPNPVDADEVKLAPGKFMVLPGARPASTASTPEGEGLKVKPPILWSEPDRRQRRARLDALYFHLYGLSKDDADYILSTFPIVARQDEAEFGRYFTRDLILAHMDALAAGDTQAEIVLR